MKTNIIKKKIGYAESVDISGKVFEYGQVKVTDYSDMWNGNVTETTYISCIRLGIVEKVKNFNGDHYVEVQFIYKDDNGKSDCLHIDRTNGRCKVEVVKKGDMQIEL